MNFTYSFSLEVGSYHMKQSKFYLGSPTLMLPLNQKIGIMVSNNYVNELLTYGGENGGGSFPDLDVTGAIFKPRPAFNGANIILPLFMGSSPFYGSLEPYMQENIGLKSLQVRYVHHEGVACIPEPAEGILKLISSPSEEHFFNFDTQKIVDSSYILFANKESAIFFDQGKSLPSYYIKLIRTRFMPNIKSVTTLDFNDGKIMHGKGKLAELIDRLFHKNKK